MRGKDRGSADPLPSDVGDHDLTPSRVLNIIDDEPGECRAVVAGTALSGKRVARDLEALIARLGRPGVLVSDNGTGLTSSGVQKFARDRKIDWHCIAPG